MFHGSQQRFWIAMPGQPPPAINPCLLDSTEQVAGLRLLLGPAGAIAVDDESTAATAGTASSEGWNALQLAPGEVVVAVSGCAGRFVERLVLHTSAGRLWTTPFTRVSMCSTSFMEAAPSGAYLVGMQLGFPGGGEAITGGWFPSAAAGSLKRAPSCSSAAPRARKAVVIRAAADNQLLKKPEVKRAEPEQKKLFGDASASAAPSGVPIGGVTVEYQRMRAKEMRQYFIDQKNEALRGKAQVFGWTPKNEISNGRWVMFGLLVGMLTEYATGVDFPHQFALMASYLGIVDLD
ncbi:hypothetical protein TSOC_000311 [Tetrabaena socialis]|uniref:Uncharacterized protein n=1 Tax=Tetrabaena socialis TaxID=47790 RepID=A0A2J8AJQ3_9CHLO|nr:hypothetical protein TSOC_000311 [Tetrabaena socialis]|eukprot:PNH12733.1 hypothetical protein TSOC_000311 [Tetrabaena socialis]